ncbi:arsenical resistance operon repressor (plasmid) [Limosilactobacillus reuteri I5007]|uniref:Arsenical resistance operon repressor n=1 Tax=Limosilactobacillus reuteri I5007 TaxID=1340495 RepID=R9WJ51_LIMRT|nr:metalloregulator ArsR/SmtB family transcription factor [Limosilactobacillus reuteri]AGO00165.1 arsenical resistance operon repressor [Limosilactobacillus reuteri I5007]MBU5284306.1 metalloregulator ArsR/SmtB family transcription factor [Limosilactobacillus reuteri]
MDYQKLASLLKVVAEPNRLQILEMLSCGEMCACDILKNFDFTQPTLSHHMKVLEKEELVRVTKKGKWHHYSLNQDTAALLINGLSKTLSNTEDCICNDKNKKC